jgi:L-seryl-tRNA(Ser) seleniumtransferase
VLVEVGTTNKTRAADYERAITPATRVLLKVHPSNYRITGFTGAPSREELVEVARRHGLVVVEDLGSGTLVDTRRFGLPEEPTVQASVRAGVDLVTFSGDKLLGGPQAGLVVGRAELVARLRTHPLMRAFRLDRLRLAALEATLRLYRDADGPPAAVPVIGMLAQDGPALRGKAERLAALLDGCKGAALEVAEDVAYAGGGALPESELPTWTVAVRPLDLSVDDVAAALRRREPPVVARIAKGRLVLDVRTLAEAELAEVAQAVREALA